MLTFNSLPPTNLTNLHDVIVASPANGQVLSYNSSSNKWQNLNPSTGVYNYLSTALTASNGLQLTFTPSTKAINVSLPNSNSTVGTFGSSTRIPVITVNAQGLVTSVTTAAATATGTGTSGVSAFNSRTGNVTLLSSDVIAALGYIPTSASPGGTPGTISAASINNLVTTTSLGAFSMDHTSSNTSSSTAINLSTTPGGWNTGAGKMTFSSEFILNNFFALNPTSHFGFVLRSSVTSVVNGHGFIVGYFTTTIPGATQPSVALETYYPASAGGGNYLWTPENTATGPVLVDGVRYKINVTSTVAPDGNKYIRSVLWALTNSASGNGDTFWDLLIDTGDVLDKNTRADFTQTYLSMFTVFDSTLSGWSIDFSNASVTWGPAFSAVSDQSKNVISRNGIVSLAGSINLIGAGNIGLATGNLKFNGASQRILLGESGTNPLLWTAVQNSAANQPTTLAVLPNGSSNTANVFVSNSGTSGTSYSAAYFGISGTSTNITSYSAGSGSNLPITISVGVGGTAGIFTSTGLDLSQNFGTGNTLKLRSDDYIALDASGNTRFKFNSSTNAIEFYTGSTRKGYISLTGADVQMNSLSSGGSSSYVDVASIQNVGGAKTFTSTPTFAAGINFSNTSQRIYLNESGTNPLLWTAIQNGAANQPTSLAILPNGSSNSANVFVSNSGLSGSTYSAAYFGITGSTTTITSFGAGGGANLPINISVGVGGTSGIFNTTGLDLSQNYNTGNTLTLRSNDYIALDASGNTKFKYNSSTDAIEFYTGSTRRGYISMTAGSDVQMNSLSSGSVLAGFDILNARYGPVIDGNSQLVATTIVAGTGHTLSQYDAKLYGTGAGSILGGFDIVNARYGAVIDGSSQLIGSTTIAGTGHTLSQIDTKIYGTGAGSILGGFDIVNARYGAVINGSSQLIKTTAILGSVLKLGSGGAKFDPTLDDIIHEMDYNTPGTQAYNTVQALASVAGRPAARTAIATRAEVGGSTGLPLAINPHIASWAVLYILVGYTNPGYWEPFPTAFLVSGDTVVFRDAATGSSIGMVTWNGSAWG